MSEPVPQDDELAQAPAPVPGALPGIKTKGRYRGKRKYVHSGYYSLVRRIKVAGSLDGAVDHRTFEAKELYGWMTTLANHLGGKEQLTPPQETLVQRAAVCEILLRQIESTLLTVGATVTDEHGNPQGRKLTDQFARLMKVQTDTLRILGIQRQVRDALDADLIRRTHLELRIEREEAERAARNQNGVEPA